MDLRNNSNNCRMIVRRVAKSFLWILLQNKSYGRTRKNPRTVGPPRVERGGVQNFTYVTFHDVTCESFKVVGYYLCKF